MKRNISLRRLDLILLTFNAVVSSRVYAIGRRRQVFRLFKRADINFS